jgi:hypothetical protein
MRRRRRLNEAGLGQHLQREPGGSLYKRFAASRSEVGIVRRRRLLNAAQQLRRFAFTLEGGAVCGEPAQIGNSGVQHRQEAMRHFIAAAAQQHVIEGAERRDVADGIAPAHRRLHVIRGGFQRVLFGLAGARDKLSRHGRLQRGTHFVDLSRLVRRHGCNRKHTPGTALHEPFGAQMLQRGPDAGAACAGLFREIAFDQSLARLQAQLQDGLAQLFRGSLGQVRRLARDLVAACRMSLHCSTPQSQGQH